MTNAELIRAIRNEIERLKTENKSIKCVSNGAYCTGYDDAFKDFLRFLYTLESEHLADARKTSPNDLEEARMMKKAVEAEGKVVMDINNELAVTAKNVNLDKFKFGDKVRVIVLKKED